MSGVRSWARHNLRQHPAVYRAVNRAVILGRFVLGRPHDRDFAVLAGISGPGVFLDVGANVGQSAFSVRAVNRGLRIYSVEANPVLEKDLRFAKRFLGDFDYRITALADSRGEMTLTIPVAGKVAATQAATLDATVLSRRQQTIERNVGGEFRLTTVLVPVTTIDELALAPTVIKIDVEGAEKLVLGGATETLRRHRPLMMMEVGVDGEAAGQLRDEFDYQLFVRSDDRLIPFDGLSDGAVNVFGVPSERVSGGVPRIA